MARQARPDSQGTLHHVIVRGIERKNIVEDNNDRINMISRLGLDPGCKGIFGENTNR